MFGSQFALFLGLRCKKFEQFKFYTGQIVGMTTWDFAKLSFAKLFRVAHANSVCYNDWCAAHGPRYCLRWWEGKIGFVLCSLLLEVAFILIHNRFGPTPFAILPLTNPHIGQRTGISWRLTYSFNMVMIVCTLCAYELTNPSKKQFPFCSEVFHVQCSDLMVLIVLYALRRNI